MHGMKYQRLIDPAIVPSIFIDVLVNVCIIAINRLLQRRRQIQAWAAHTHSHGRSGPYL